MAQRNPIEPLDDAPDVDHHGIDVLTPEEAREVFEADIRRLLGISGDEFLRRYDAGELVPYDEEGENVRVVSAILSMTLVRPCTWEGGHLRFLS